MCPPPLDLAPRKSPRQARSAATLDAIFEATIQVLLTEDASRLTTTRVAERAGVSVGTMYQYYPHKHALLYAALRWHLDALVSVVEATCAAQQGATLAVMSEALAQAWISIKTGRCDVTRALYRINMELDAAPLGEDVFVRCLAAARAMLVTAADATFADPDQVASLCLLTLSGTLRAMFDYTPALVMDAGMHAQIVMLCRAYLEAARDR